MSLHVVCGLRNALHLMLSNGIAWSETLAASGARSANAVPGDGRPWALLLTAETKMFVSVGPLADASANPRFVLLAGDKMILQPSAGDVVHWITKP